MVTAISRYSATWVRYLAVLVTILGFGGCTGWSMKPFTLEGLNKVYVPYFKNDTFYRRVEHDLTREVISRIQQRPDIHLVDENSAQLILKGRIIDYQLRILAEDRQDRVTSASSTITVEVQVVRARDGRVLRETRLRDTARFDELANETLESAREDSYSILSQRIVDLLEEDI